MLKNSKLLFGILAVLGAVLIGIFFIVFYWEQTWSAKLLSVQILLGDSYLDWARLDSFFFFTIIAGTALLVVGTIGTIMKSHKKHRTVFAILTVVLVSIVNSWHTFFIIFSSLLPTNGETRNNQL